MDAERKPCCFGLIPACAGKTSCARSTLELCGAHPRVCGENLGGALGSLGGMGSSPRVRGKLKISRVLVSIPGLIPACAGKTVFGVGDCGGEEAHPRVCGENRYVWDVGTQYKGSSPRVRGKLLSRFPCGRTVGLIPACAGKTCAPEFS